ncbi:MAG: hypothetical protein HY425_02390 [Candidatus Levybacteria bacterium]|nr:hypothetical protein [Candidatus Levybacteria bacterium]
MERLEYRPEDIPKSELDELLEEWEEILSKGIALVFDGDTSNLLKTDLLIAKKASSASNPSLSSEMTSAFFFANFQGEDFSEDILRGVELVTESILIAENEIAGRTDEALAEYEAGIRQAIFLPDEEINFLLAKRRSRAEKSAKLMRDDPSGILLANETLRSLKGESPVFADELAISNPRVQPQLLIMGAEKAAQVYEKVYRLCPPATPVSQSSALFPQQ